MAEGKSIGREEKSRASASSFSHGMGAEGREQAATRKGIGVIWRASASCTLQSLTV